MIDRVALVDRDGTINEDLGYVLDPEGVRLIPGAAEGLRKLREAGLGIVVVTNQSPVGRGLLTTEGLEAIHERLRALLAAEGAAVDAFEVCPHAPDDGCDCRKPGVGMVRHAAAALGFDPAASFVIGDHAGDMELGRRVGATTILVLTGHGGEEMPRAAALADHVAADLREAAGLVEEIVMNGAPA